MPAVGRPVQLLHAAERLGGQLEKLFRAEDVHGIFRGNQPVHQGCDIAAGYLGHPVVPVAVHQVFCGVGVGLVEGGIEIGRGLQGGVLDAAHIQDLLLVRGDLEVADPGGDIAEFHALTEFVALQGRFPELAALQEINASAVGGPASAADALRVVRELDFIGAVGVAEEEVAAAAVVRDGGVGHAVENLASVGGELGIGQAAEGEERLGRHHAVLDADVGCPDIAAIFFLCTTDGHNQTGKCNYNAFHEILL